MEMHELIYSIIYSIIYHFWWFWSPFVGSALFQVTKNGTGSAQIEERTPKTLRNTPQNGGVDIWFMRFHFRPTIMPIRPSRFTLLKGQKLKKMPYATIFLLLRILEHPNEQGVIVIIHHHCIWYWR